MVIFQERWDGNIFVARTVGINGFSMVFGSLNHHHLMIFSPKTIAFNVF